MRPLFYLRRLKEDVAGWVSKGIISSAQGEAILADIGAAKGTSFAQLLVVLGALLAGAAAITFVAANWDGMPKVARLGVLLLALAAAWWIAAEFFRRGKSSIAQAFVLLAIGVFGACVNLVGQTYHMNADYPDGLMIWALGALAAAAIVPSRTALGAALVLGAIWTFIETMNFTPGLHLPYALFWLAAAGLAVALRWRGGAHLVALALLFWLLISFEPIAEALGVSEDEVFSYYAAAGLALFAWALPADDPPWRIVAHYGALLFLGLGFFWHVAALGALDEAGWREAMGQGGGPSLAEYARAHLLTLIAGAGFLVALFGRRLPLAAAVAGLSIVAWDLASYFIALAIGPAVVVLSYWIGVLAVIAIGAVLGRRALINIGLVGFAAGVLNLYFETFRGLLGTSVVFLVGAVLLFALAFAIQFAGKRLAGRKGGAA